MLYTINGMGALCLPIAKSHSNTLYTLLGRGGVQVDLCALGARIMAVRTPDRQQKLQNISLAFTGCADDFAGATVGPVAGRLADGRLSILGETFLLTQNERGNTLHGGKRNLSRTLWNVSENDAESIVFSCVLPDGLEGFPGNRRFAVRYALDENNLLTIRYTASTDSPTFLNLTNHTYWNLSGDFTTSAHGQVLEIASDTVLYNDAAHLPIARCAVKDTPFDFTAPRRVCERLQSEPAHPQLVNALGYNNAFELRAHADFAARLSDSRSGRRVTVRTDYPYLVFYSGGYLPVAGSAFALEAQFAPGSCEPVLLADELYQRQISFQFDVI